MPGDKLPDSISKNALASLIGITPTRVAQLDREGVFVRVARGKYQLQDAVKAYCSRLRQTAQGGATSSAADEVRRLRAHELRLRIAERERELIPMTEAMSAVDAICGRFREAFESLPARLSRNLVQRRIFDDLVHDELTRTVDHFAKVARELQAGEANDVAVGRARQGRTRKARSV